MIDELLLNAPDLDTFKRNIHKAFGWNMQPLTTAEILRLHDALRCPECGKPRYMMWRMVAFSGTCGEFCVCPEQEVSNV